MAEIDEIAVAVIVNGERRKVQADATRPSDGPHDAHAAAAASAPFSLIAIDARRSRQRDRRAIDRQHPHDARVQVRLGRHR